MTIVQAEVWGQCSEVWGTAEMATFSGVATLNDDRIPVTVGIDDDKISLVSGDGPIAEWAAGECDVVEVATGTYVISAAEDSIAFQPDDPGGFARGLGVWSAPGKARAKGAGADPAPSTTEAPLPGKATMVGFYVLVAVTGLLMLWAVISMLT